MFDTTDNPAGSAGEGENITLTGGAETPPPGGNESVTGPAGSGGTETAPPAPAAGIVLTGKDDTGTGTDTSEAGTRSGGNEGGEGAGGGDAGGAEESPITYPEGFVALPEAEQGLRAHVNAKNLPPEAAAAEKQALADLYVKTRQGENAALMAKLNETKRAWAEELAADPDYGGANLAGTGKDANLGLRHYAPDLAPLLAEWNLESHPALVRHFARLGRGLRENRSPRAEKPGQRRPKTLVDSKEEMLAQEEARARKA